MGIDKINVNSQTYTGNITPKATPVQETAKKAPVPEKTVSREVKKPVLTNDDKNKAMEEIAENNKNVKNAIAEVNKKMNQKTRCEFSYHEDTKRVSIKVIDAATDKVVREIPPEETLDMISKMWEVAGILFDEQR